MQEIWFDPWVRKILWRRQWQSTPVFLPGESHGQRSLEGYNPWDHKESDSTESLSMHACKPMSPQQNTNEKTSTWGEQPSTLRSLKAQSQGELGLHLVPWGPSTPSTLSALSSPLVPPAPALLLGHGPASAYSARNAHSTGGRKAWGQQMPACESWLLHLKFSGILWAGWQLKNTSHGEK